MRIVSSSDLGSNIHAVMQTCFDQHEPAIIADENQPAMLMIPLADFNKNHEQIMDAVREFERIETIKKHEHDPEWAETIHLMRSAKNHSILMKSIDNISKGFYQPRDLIEV